MRYAKGKHSKGRDARSGDKVKYKDMVSDGQFPGLRVMPEWRDIKHPVEKPFDAEEGIALRFPAPDIEDDSGIGLNDDNEVLADTLDGESFGGGT
jgi:hypothetical protein